MKLNLQELQPAKSIQTREDLFFHLLETKDGSFSCICSESFTEKNESMHSMEGAFSETEFIYGKAIQRCLDESLTPHFINIGLGIAYNEISILSHCLRHSTPRETIFIESFEFYPELEQAIQSFFLNPKLENPFSFVYRDILQRNAQLFELATEEILNLGRSLIENKQWSFSGKFSEHASIQPHASCVLFDAYSKQTSPDLWSEKCLDFLLKSLSPKAILSTYAATGVLNRSLKEHHFVRNSQAGFAHKRESTFATRGLCSEA